jgi:pilus assembly protein FimV
MALGLGEMQLESFLNEPLKASVDLLNMGGLHEDEIRVRLATTEDFDKLGLERAYFLTTVTFEVVSNGAGGAQILIRSEEPVLEPYLDFVVEARWPSGRLLREYTVLVDPPVFSQSTPVVSASERVSASEGVPAPDGVPAPVDYNERYQSGSSRVDMSGLAAGTAPQRDYSGASAGAAKPGSRYTIRRDQTLWEIASQAKPAGTSVHQMMLDIQRLNPDAFINGNINRIKAGYVIYLPTAEDISSGDVSNALAEVREQNEAWRQGRDDALYTSRGPSLRISAEPEATAEGESNTSGRSGQAEGQTAQAGEPQQPGSSTEAPATAAAAGLPASDTQARLAALEQQLETLQRIVSLKDDQIAALQNALTDAGAEVPAVGSEQVTSDVVEGAEVAGSAEVAEVTEALAPATAPETEEPAESSAVVDEALVEEEVTVPPAVVGEQVAETAKAKKSEEQASEKATPTPPAVESGEGWTRYLLYVLGALVLAVAGLVIARRRGEVDDSAEEETTLPIRQATAQKDVFADVRLQDQNLEVEPIIEEPSFLEDRVPSMRDNRGYGERKHDEYASDIDAADALAEADIYIAYGRHPQAIDLLNTALTAEPGNPVYRLKLLEIYVELDNRVAATAQLRKIEAIGDPDSIARAEALMERLSGDEELELPTPNLHKPVNRGPGLSPNPLQMLTDSSEALEEDFSGLEIEEHSEPGDEDDLDLSGDFAVVSSAGYEDEELVIAADSNALSTKLDLARAYLDMGDDDGARQILDEVVAEGTEDLKAEAQALLSRIG